MHTRSLLVGLFVGGALGIIIGVVSDRWQDLGTMPIVEKDIHGRCVRILTVEYGEEAVQSCAILPFVGRHEVRQVASHREREEVREHEAQG